MPVYDIRCPKCLSIERDVHQPPECVQPHCRQCLHTGNVMERVWLAGPPVHIFPAGFFENAADGDGHVPYFDSRQRYKSYLKEHGMYADLVEGR